MDGYDAGAAANEAARCGQLTQRIASWRTWLVSWRVSLVAGAQAADYYGCVDRALSFALALAMIVGAEGASAQGTAGTAPLGASADATAAPEKPNEEPASAEPAFTIGARPVWFLLAGPTGGGTIASDS